MNESTPSLVRLRRVDYFLKRDAKYVSTETQNYQKGSDNIPFPVSAWKVAIAINSANLDACSMNKKQVHAWADHVLFGAPAPQQGAPAATTEVQEGQEVKAAAQPRGADDNAFSNDCVGPIKINPRIAIYSLLLSARELALMDRAAGSAELVKLIDPPTEAYYKALNVVAQNPPVTTTVPPPEIPQQVVAEAAPTATASPAPATVPIPA